MTLGDAIRQYRLEHGMSQRQFAEKSKLSNGYIAMLERGVNPTTGKPLAPSIDKYGAIANAMGLSLNELFTAMEDSPIRVNVKLNGSNTRGNENTELTNAMTKLAHSVVRTRERLPQRKMRVTEGPRPGTTIIRAENVPVKAEPKADLTPEERSLIEAFRAADDRAKDNAFKMLLDHPKYN